MYFNKKEEELRPMGREEVGCKEERDLVLWDSLELELEWEMPV